jgi:hypothetical protein
MTRFIGSPYFTDALSERRYFRACVVEGLRLNLGDVVAVEVKNSVLMYSQASWHYPFLSPMSNFSVR